MTDLTAIDEARERREAASMVMLANRVANILVETGLVKPIELDDLDDDVSTEREFGPEEFVRSLWIADDVNNPQRVARYQVIRSNDELFLTRSADHGPNGNAYVLPARAARMKVIAEDFNAHTAEDFHALFRSLPKLVEVAKFPAAQLRQWTTRKIDRALRADKLELKAQVPALKTTVAADVQRHMTILISPAAQISRDALFEDRNEPQQVLDATIRQDVSLTDMEKELREARMDFSAQENFIKHAPDLNAIQPQAPLGMRPALSIVPSLNLV